MTMVGSIYVQVLGDTTKFKKEMSELKSWASKSGTQVSNALNNAISPTTASKGIKDLSVELSQLARSAKAPADSFKNTAATMAAGLKGVAKEAGLTEKQYASMLEKMLRNRALTTATTSLKKLSNAMGLNARESKALAKQMGYTGSQANKMAGALKNMKGGMGQVNTTARMFTQNIGMMSAELIGFGSAIAAAYTIKELGTAIYKTGQETLIADNAYKAITGSVAAANAEMAFLRETSGELGLNFYTLRDGYKGFLAAAQSSKIPMEEVRAIFGSISNASAVMGLSAEKTSLVFLALEQMMSKGKISMEEIRRQMGDSLPGAFQIGAKAMGMTVEAFDKAVSAGEIYAEDFLPKFRVAMEEAFQGTIPDSVRAVNKLAEAWEDTKNQFAQSGVVDNVTHIAYAISEKMQEVVAEVQTSGTEINKLLDDIGDAFVRNINDVDIDNVATSLRGIASGLGNIMDIYSALPTGSTAGIIGTVLFGPKAGAIAFLAIQAERGLDMLGLGIRDLIEYYLVLNGATEDFLKKAKLMKGIGLEDTFDSNTIKSYDDAAKAVSSIEQRITELTVSSQKYVTRFGQPQWSRDQEAAIRDLEKELVNLIVRKEELYLAEAKLSDLDYDRDFGVLAVATEKAAVSTNNLADAIHAVDWTGFYMGAKKSTAPIQHLADAIHATDWTGFYMGAKKTSDELSRIAREAKNATDSLRNIGIDNALNAKGTEYGFGDIDAAESMYRRDQQTARNIEVQSGAADTYGDYGSADDGLADQQAAEDKQLEIVKAGNEAFAALGKSKYELERENIEELTKIRIAAGMDELKANAVLAEQLKAISMAERKYKEENLLSTVSTMSDGFKNIAEMGGKYSKEAFAMYKAFKIVETVINTKNAAMAAYSSMVGIPFVGPILAVAAAGAAIAFGTAQVSAISNLQPPSYDVGGISSARGIYQTGDIQEAHVPIPSGKIPVEINGGSKGGGTEFNVVLNNPVFQDLNTQRQVMTQIATVIAAKVAPGAVIQNYKNDGAIRSMMKGGI